MINFLLAVFNLLLRFVLVTLLHFHQWNITR